MTRVEMSRLCSGSSCNPPRVTAVVKLARARQVFQALEVWVMSEESRHLPLREVERQQVRRGREIQRGTGDIGPAIDLEVVDYSGAERFILTDAWIPGIPRPSLERSPWSG
jgi:hypothetical protein